MSQLGLDRMTIELVEPLSALDFLDAIGAGQSREQLTAGHQSKTLVVSSARRSERSSRLPDAVDETINVDAYQASRS